MLFCVSSNVFANFLVLAGESRINEDRITHEAELQLALSDDVVTAITKGIEIRLVYDFRLLRIRPVIWDDEIAAWKFSVRIKYHGLSNSFILENDYTGKLDTFDSIRDVLDDLSRFRVSVPIVGSTLPQSDSGYRMAFKIELDKNALPPPLKLLVEISPTWDLASSWKQWPVIQ